MAGVWRNYCAETSTKTGNTLRKPVGLLADSFSVLEPRYFTTAEIVDSAPHYRRPILRRAAACVALLPAAIVLRV